MRVYDKRVKRIINTKTDIPDELMAKKDFLLPVEKETITFYNDEEPEKEAGTFVEKNKVRVVKHNKLIRETLESVKEENIKRMKSYVQRKFPINYRQRNASIGVYDASENDRIINEVKKWDKYVDDNKVKINGYKTIKGVNDYDYRTEEDIKKAEEMDDEMN